MRRVLRVDDFRKRAPRAQAFYTRRERDGDPLDEFYVTTTVVHCIVVLSVGVINHFFSSLKTMTNNNNSNIILCFDVLLYVARVLMILVRARAHRHSGELRITKSLAPYARLLDNSRQTWPSTTTNYHYYHYYYYYCLLLRHTYASKIICESIVKRVVRFFS